MSSRKLEVKVGLFVFFCLALLAGLLLQFSKGATLFRPTKTIIVDAANVGGLRARASVLMSGVQVGTVSKTILSPEGTNVSIYLKIYTEFSVREDALFKIEQAGFLGDQYVAIYPGKSDTKELEPNAHVHAEEPFNLQEVARSTSGFIKRLDETAKKLDDTINDVRSNVLNERVLTNLADTIINLRKASEDAIVAVNNVNELVKTNGEPASHAVSNLLAFTDRLNGIADHAQSLLTSNTPTITLAIDNLKHSSSQITNILGQIEAGKGTAGALVNNQEMANNFAALAQNLAITSSNLNRLGFWHFIWYKPPATNSTAHPGH